MSFVTAGLGSAATLAGAYLITPGLAVMVAGAAVAAWAMLRDAA